MWAVLSAFSVGLQDRLDVKRTLVNLPSICMTDKLLRIIFRLSVSFYTGADLSVFTTLADLQTHRLLLVV